MAARSRATSACSGRALLVGAPLALAVPVPVAAPPPVTMGVCAGMAAPVMLVVRLPACAAVTKVATTSGSGCAANGSMENVTGMDVLVLASESFCSRRRTRCPAPLTDTMVMYCASSEAGRPSRRAMLATMSRSSCPTMLCGSMWRDSSRDRKN